MAAKLSHARRIALPLLIGVAVLGTVVLTMLSPLFLASLASTFDTKWEELSWIGQTYGAASALLSALALLSIGISIFLQERESRRVRQDSARAQHLQLVQLLIENPALIEATGLKRSRRQDPRHDLYLNLLVSYWETLYSVGQLTPGNVREYARVDLFCTEIGMRFWARSRRHRRDIALALPRSKRQPYIDVFELIDGVWWDMNQPPRATPLDRSNRYLVLGAAAACCTAGYLMRALLNKRKARAELPARAL
ncbi:DUF6082 family protein [Nonomuraea sp. NPDC050310]|uniref:DUF6082 family protein n=1 Tax=Nonomuraea sp. NPDC050310 TaxID=3154935 RepID=UPI0033CC2BB0